MERDRAIIEHAEDACFTYDAGGRIFVANRRARETLGYTREELLSLSITYVEAILLPEGVAGLWRRLASGKSVTTEGARRRKEGTAFPSRSVSAFSGRPAGGGSRSPWPARSSSARPLQRSSVRSPHARAQRRPGARACMMG